jgi:outer membrane receptor protein involved in Fe transport
MSLSGNALLLSALLLVAAGPAAAAPQLEAQVVNKGTGRPVSGAEVTILGHPGERFTDAEGRFTWQPSPAPPFEMLVILPGGRFMKPVLIEKLPPNGPLIVQVEGLLNESVTVAAGAAPSIETTPGSGTTLLTGGEIAARAPSNIAQALENVPGVSTVSEGQAAVPTIRGFSGGRTLILLDGARVTSERRAGPSATFLDPFSLDSVEVSRGPGSVAYGSDAFGGVISARTRRVAPGSPLRARALIALGAGSPERRGAFDVARGFARGGVLVQAHARQFDDYRSPDGDIFNSGARDHGVLTRLEHAVGPGDFSIGWQSDFGRDVERPRNNSRTVRFYYPTEDSHRLTTGYELHRFHGFERVSVTGFFGSSSVVTDQDRSAAATQPRSIERADVAARDYQFRVLAERTLGSAHLEFGTDLNGRFGLHATDDRILFDLAGDQVRTDSNVSVDAAHRTDTGFFASLQVPLPKRVLLAGGIRGDRVTTENRGGYFGDRSTAQGAGSGYASATFGSFRGFTITAQAARGFRDPVLSDRYFRGPSGRGFVTGNPDLESETSIQFDTAVRYTGSRYRAAVYGFHYRISDLVERYEDAADFFFFRNRGRARVRGVEAETQVVFGRGVTVELAGQVTRGRAVDDDAWLDGIPQSSLSLQLRKLLGPRGFLQVRGAAYARDEQPGPTERIVPGYAVVDLGGGWTFRERLELRVLGRNLLDQPYLVSPDTRTVLAPGASVLATLSLRIPNH